MATWGRPPPLCCCRLSPHLQPLPAPSPLLLLLPSSPASPPGPLSSLLLRWSGGRREMNPCSHRPARLRSGLLLAAVAALLLQTLVVWNFGSLDGGARSRERREERAAGEQPRWKRGDPPPLGGRSTPAAGGRFESLGLCGGHVKMLQLPHEPRCEVCRFNASPADQLRKQRLVCEAARLNTFIIYPRSESDLDTTSLDRARLRSTELRTQNIDIC